MLFRARSSKIIDAFSSLLSETPQHARELAVPPLIIRHSNEGLHEVLQVLVQDGPSSVLLLPQREKRFVVGARLALVPVPLALVRHGPGNARRASLARAHDEMEAEEALPALEGPLSQGLRVVQAAQALRQRSRMRRVGKVLFRRMFGGQDMQRGGIDVPNVMKESLLILNCVIMKRVIVDIKFY